MTFNEARASRRSGEIEDELLDLGIRTKPKRGSSHRKSKVADGIDKAVKPKFQEQRNGKVYELVAKTANQAKYIEFLKSKQLVGAFGSSGCGKSFVACVHAGNKLLKGEIETIVLIRPFESVGQKSIGMRKGTTQEKLLPLMQSMLQPLQEVLGQGHYLYALENGQIVMEALEDVRGRSYKNAIVIADEIQNVDTRTMQTLVTRIGEGSQLVLCGDGIKWQTDIKGSSGLPWFTNMLSRLRKDIPTYLDADDKNQLMNNIGIVTFNKEDVVRSGLCKMFVKVFDEEVECV